MLSSDQRSDMGQPLQAFSKNFPEIHIPICRGGASSPHQQFPQTFLLPATACEIMAKTMVPFASQKSSGGALGQAQSLFLLVCSRWPFKFPISRQLAPFYVASQQLKQLRDWLAAAS